MMYPNKIFIMLLKGSRNRHIFHPSTHQHFAAVKNCYIININNINAYCVLGVDIIIIVYTYSSS